MKTFLLKAIMTLVVIQIQINTIKSQETTFLILDGDTSWFYIQEDVFEFVLHGKAELQMNFPPNIVEEHIYTEDSVNRILFNPQASMQAIQSVVDSIENDQDFEQEFESISWSLSSHWSGNYFRTNDLIEVIFKDTNMAEEDVTQFQNDFGLDLYWSPPEELPSGHYTYIFNVLPEEDNYISSIQKAQEIHEQSDLILVCVPDLATGNIEAVPNDPKFSELWHFRNTGQATCGSGTSIAGSDIDILEAWNRDDEYGYGSIYTGNGVIVGIMDVDNFELTHPDLNGQFVDGWDATREKVIDQNYYERYNRSHGTWVSSIVGAKADNNEGIVGVAYGSKLRPLAHSFFDSQITMCLQKCLTPSFKVDVLNMSFSKGSFPSVQAAKAFPAYNELRNCYLHGRDGKGIVLVAASGNDLTGIFPDRLNFPNAFEEVLTVGASTPADKAKAMGDGFAVSSDWNSMNPPSLDVIAPGTCLWGTDLWGSNGASPNGYYKIGGTSGAAPIVAGLAALILEKNPELTADEIYDIIRKSADQVGGYDYHVDANRPGWSSEAGYGRVNAKKAVRTYTPHVSIHDYENRTVQLEVSNPFSDELMIRLEQDNEYIVKLSDLSGKEIGVSSIRDGLRIKIDTQELPSGVYILSVYSPNFEESWTGKVIKK